MPEGAVVAASVIAFNGSYDRKNGAVGGEDRVVAYGTLGDAGEEGKEDREYAGKDKVKREFALGITVYFHQTGENCFGFGMVLALVKGLIWDNECLWIHL